MPGRAIGPQLNQLDENIWFARQLAICKGLAGFKYDLQATVGDIDVEAIVHKHLKNAVEELNSSKM